MNGELFAIDQLRKENDVPTPLIYLSDEFRDNKLLIPEYQREYVWEDNKLKGWINTVISGKAIGVIVTYQLDNDSRIYLADGLQRLTATNKFLDDPERYGFHFGIEQARSYCRSFSITVQHRIYKDHYEAMEAFKALNRGTALRPGEFHKGEITLSEVGRNIYNQLPIIVDRYETRFLSRTYRGGLEQKDPKYVRDCLALFLQYISLTEQLSFWNVASGKVRKEVSVEQKLQEHFDANNITLDDLKDIYYRFEEFAGSHFAVIDSVLKDIDMTGKPMSLTVSRWLFHLNLWRKNTGRPVNLYVKYITELLKKTKIYSTINSHIDIPNEKAETVLALKIQLDTLRQLKEIGEYIGVTEFYEYKRKNNPKTQTGYHRSHKQPLSMFGDGETIIEPAMLNMARGASAIP